MEFRNFLAVSSILFLLNPAPAARAENDRMNQCVEEQGGSAVAQAQCSAQYQQQLQQEQTATIDRLHALLAGPAPEGADYRAAARSLKRAQKHWLAYVKADCTVTDVSFGEGSSRGLAGAACASDHYATRNAELRDLEKAIDPKARLDE